MKTWFIVLPAPRSRPALGLAILLLLLIITPSSAFAKKMDFDAMHVGIAFFGGQQSAATTSLAPDGAPKRAPIYNYEGGFEIMVPFDDLILRAIYSSQHYSIYSGNATDSTGTYNQSTAGNIRLFGAKISINSFVSQDRLRRLYFGAGLGKSTVTAGLHRRYASGATTGAFSAEAVGGAMQWDIHAGFGCFLVQNWAFFVEGGYRKMDVNELTFTGNKNLAGATIVGSKSVLTETGSKASFKGGNFNAIAGLMIAF